MGSDRSRVPQTHNEISSTSSRPGGSQPLKEPPWDSMARPSTMTNTAPMDRIYSVNFRLRAASFAVRYKTYFHTIFVLDKESVFPYTESRKEIGKLR